MKRAATLSVERAAVLSVGAELQLHLGDQAMAGTRRMQLLAEIARAGSITQAAKTVGLSYKGAWDAVARS